MELSNGHPSTRNASTHRRTAKPLGAPTSDLTNQPSGVNRRSLIKGAAWPAPVVAVAAAAPLAAASTNPTALLRIDADCLIGVSGATIGRGFRVSNVGTEAYTDGSITVVETITLSGLAAPLAVAIWPLLGVQGILGGGSSNVTRGNWSGGLFSTTRSRTVTITGPLASGANQSWGIALDVVSGIIDTLGLLGLPDIAHTATITSPTGNPPVQQSSAAVDWSLITTTCD